jgi:hypothetical protein
MKSPYFEFIKAIAKRAEVSQTPWDILEYYDITEETWIKCSFMPSFEIPNQPYRIASQVIDVNGFKVADGLREISDDVNTVYYYPCFSEEDFYSCCYSDFSGAPMLLKLGLMYLTEAGAIARAKAMLKIDPNTLS